MTDAAYDRPNFGGNTGSSYNDEDEERAALLRLIGGQTAGAFDPTSFAQAGLQDPGTPQVMNPDPFSAPGVTQPGFRSYGIGGLLGQIGAMNKMSRPHEPRQIAPYPGFMASMMGGLL